MNPPVQQALPHPPNQPQRPVVIYLTDSSDSDSEEEEEVPSVPPKLLIRGRLASLDAIVRSVDGLLDRNLLDFFLYDPNAQRLNWRVTLEAFQQIVAAREQRPADTVSEEHWWDSFGNEYRFSNGDAETDHYPNEEGGQSSAES